MFKKKRELTDIAKEMEQVKFKAHQYTQDLKVLRGKRNELEDDQSKETMHTTIDETVGRVQQLKDVGDRIIHAEQELDACLVEQNNLEDEIISIIDSVKVVRDDAIDQFEKEVTRVEKLAKQLQSEVNKLAEQRKEIVQRNSKIRGIADKYLNKTKAQRVTASEHDSHCSEQVRQIRNLLVKQAGQGMDAIG